MKKVFTIITLMVLIVLLAIKATRASAPVEEWSKIIGDNASFGYSVQQTKDGGYIIAGANAGGLYLLKRDSFGEPEWEKTFDNAVAGQSVQQTKDGGYIITGWANTGGIDVYLIKTDPNGDKKWERTFGGDLADEGYSVQQTKDGGYIIVGTSRRMDDEAGLTTDVYLVKTFSNGDKDWERTFPGDGSEYPNPWCDDCYYK